MIVLYISYYCLYSKEAIKKLLGRSPDYADSLVYANWVKTYRGGIKWYMAISGGL